MDIYCSDNNLSKQAILDIFNSLSNQNNSASYPERRIVYQNGSVKIATIDCMGNPGFGELTDSDKKIALDKNWMIRIKNGYLEPTSKQEE